MNLRGYQAIRRSIAALVSFTLIFGPGAVAETFRYKLVSRDVVESRLKRYAGDNKNREATLLQMFAAAGCDEHLSEQPVKGSKQHNVVCVLPGSTEKAIIVGAHFDRVREGDGVVDNWSGASLLPSLYEAVKIEPRNHTYVFVGFTDEEQGEVGSNFYARKMTKEQVAATNAMVNMDTLGLGSAKVWSSRADKHLLGALVYVAKELSIPVSGVNVEQIGDTDSEQFSARKIPSITIHSLTQETWNARILHSSKNKLSAVRLDDYYQSYRLLAAYVTFLDVYLLKPDVSTKK